MQASLKNVLVIGGGMAGLSAATKLCEAGIPVTVLETNAQLGGRARGVEVNDLMLDNGQHMLIGAYQQTQSLLTLAGVHLPQHFLRLPLYLNVFDLAKNTRLSLSTSHHLPAPLHLLFGLMFATGLSLHEKLSALRWLIHCKWQGYQLAQDITVLDLLTQANQSQALIDSLWEPLCLGALNTPIHLASAQVFLNVLRDSFNKHKQDSDFLLAKTDLTQALSQPLADYIQQHGVRIVQHRAQHLRLEEGLFSCDDPDFTHKNGAYKNAVYSHLIIAVAPHQLQHLSFEGFSLPRLKFEYQAITTVYLQFEATVGLPQAMLGFCHGTAQWVFDRGQICGQAGLLAVVISAHGPWQMDNQAEKALWVRTLIEEINRSLEHKLPVKPTWFKVITEKKATFSCEHALTRPSIVTDTHNLLLAGDYVAGDYPATIEGAVISGVNAAQAIIHSH